MSKQAYLLCENSKAASAAHCSYTCCCFLPSVYGSAAQQHPPFSEHEQTEPQSCLSTRQHYALVLLCKQPLLWVHTCEDTAWKRRTGGHLESQLLRLGLQQRLHPINLTGLGTMRCCCMHVYVGHNHLQHSISKDSMLAIECQTADMAYQPDQQL
jgi:hypothetical protein